MDAEEEHQDDVRARDGKDVHGNCLVEVDEEQRPNRSQWANVIKREAEKDQRQEGHTDGFCPHQAENRGDHQRRNGDNKIAIAEDRRDCRR
jgi:hypothetical protein